jgi:DNA-binding LacI/PurR family transcriptional regulator
MKELIKVKAKTGTCSEIVKKYGVSIQTVSLALNGKTNSDLARKIRMSAVKLGGDPIYRN